MCCYFLFFLSYLLFFFFFFFFFFNATATTEIYTFSLHDALPISGIVDVRRVTTNANARSGDLLVLTKRSEEHTSELQSLTNLVCRLLLEKKKKKKKYLIHEKYI